MESTIGTPTTDRVGDMLGHDATTIQRWANDFNEKGFAAMNSSLTSFL